MITYEKLTEITKESSEVFAGKMLHAYCDMVTLPNGKPARREYVRHIGAVAIVPMTDEGNVVMERQFRYPVGEVVLEIPGQASWTIRRKIAFGQQRGNFRRKQEYRRRNG